MRAGQLAEERRNALTRTDSDVPVWLGPYTTVTVEVEFASSGAADREGVEPRPGI